MEHLQHKEQDIIHWPKILLRDLYWVAGSCVVILLILKIFFMQTGLDVIAKLILGVLWLFVLPGYSMMIYWRKNLELKEVIVVGSLLSAGLIGIMSYYGGLIGIHAIFHKWIIPPAIIIISIIINIVLSMRHSSKAKEK